MSIRRVDNPYNQNQENLVSPVARRRLPMDDQPDNVCGKDEKYEDMVIVDDQITIPQSTHSTSKNLYSNGLTYRIDDNTKTRGGIIKGKISGTEVTNLQTDSVDKNKGDSEIGERNVPALFFESNDSADKAINNNVNGQNIPAGSSILSKNSGNFNLSLDKSEAKPIRKFWGEIEAKLDDEVDSIMVKSFLFKDNKPVMRVKEFNFKNNTKANKEVNASAFIIKDNMQLRTNIVDTKAEGKKISIKERARSKNQQERPMSGSKRELVIDEANISTRVDIQPRRPQ